VATVTIDVPGGRISAYGSRPANPSPWPGVVVVHDALGMSHDLRNQADWLSGEGYLAAAPDLFRGRNRTVCIVSIMRQATTGHGQVFDDIDATRVWLTVDHDVKEYPAAGRGRRATRHRDVEGGSQRAAVLGAGDGLLTNLSLVLGVAGASSTDASTVRLAGIAGLLAGAFSMAAGELVSVRAQQEMIEKEVEVERRELADEPEAELRELSGMYRAQGVSPDDADTVARILSANPKIALDTHARLELGINPEAPSAAGRAAVFSFLSFAVGAILPLFPWFFTEGTSAVVASIIIGGLAALGLGAAIGAFSGRSMVRTALRQLAVAAVAAAVTYGVGSLLGVSTS
jgi:vacuolar iron transporter family protein